jgi:integrase
MVRDRKESMKYQVRLLVMSSGERLPVLCTSDGQPVMGPMIYVLTELRAQGRASATIRHALQAIMVLQMTLDRHQIDLDARLKRRMHLQIHEVDLIARAANSPVRTNQGQSDRQLCRASAANRLHYILQYLRWHSMTHLMSLSSRSQEYLALRDRIDKACSALKARSPCLGVRSEIDQRQGLSAQHLTVVQSVANGSRTAWQRGHAAARNQLILWWLLELGIRRGELAAVRLSDIDFQQRIVRIARRADAKCDPRANQPLAKTRARDLELSEDLCEATSDYVLKHRMLQGRARRHDFLFVAGGTGRPLSLPGLNKVFSDLRRSDLDLPASLTPHVMRHTWNDLFSETMEKLGVAPEREQIMRSDLMGWSRTSETASTYTRRYVRARAGEAMKSMQGRLRVDGGTQ